MSTPNNKLTYCNPLVLPDYPKGMFVPGKDNIDYGWIYPDQRRDFREAADPCVLYHDGMWYLYVSCGSAYMSKDFINWEHHPIDPYNLEYDPRVAFIGGQFVLTASRSPIFVGPTPLGPFEKLGHMKKPCGNTVNWGAPHMFEDDDGSIYGYWGIAGPGLYGAQIDPEDLTQFMNEPEILATYNPEHEWECFGDSNEDPSRSFVEGPWMYKHKGKYYLVYSAPGTEWKSYAFGYYVGDSPLGPFKYGNGNPFVRKTTGYVTGTGHGCLTSGPMDTTWAFYTCLVRNEHNFERRVGADRVEFDPDGVPICMPTDTPQPAPGTDNQLGWKSVTTNRPFQHSSCTCQNASGLYALDGYMHTWWMPDESDHEPTLEVELKQSSQKQSTFMLHAVRIHWKEQFLDYRAGKAPKPIGYRIEFKTRLTDIEWRVAFDATNNQTDLLLDYREFPAVEAQAVRLVISQNPYVGEVGVIDFTVFGTPGNMTREIEHMDSH